MFEVTHSAIDHLKKENIDFDNNSIRLFMSAG